MVLGGGSGLGSGGVGHDLNVRAGDVAEQSGPMFIKVVFLARLCSAVYGVVQWVGELLCPRLLGGPGALQRRDVLGHEGGEPAPLVPA